MHCALTVQSLPAGALLNNAKLLFPKLIFEIASATERPETIVEIMLYQHRNKVMTLGQDKECMTTDKFIKFI